MISKYRSHSNGYIISGAAPVVKSCGNFHANTTDGDICDQYSHWRAKNECVPELDYQFLSANVEVAYYQITLLRYSYCFLLITHV